MPTSQRVHGIVNGHWEPSPPQPPTVVTVVRTGVAKLLQIIIPRAHQSTDAARPPGERQEQVAAE